MDPDLTPMEEDILVSLLCDGDNTANGISQQIGKQRESVSRSCSDMVDNGLMRLKTDRGASVYALTRQGIKIARTILRDRSESIA